MDLTVPSSIRRICPAVEATAEVTSASVDNIKLVGAGKADLAFSLADTASDGFHGTGKFKNGRDYDNRYAWIVEIRDGMIFAIREYMDTAYIASITS